MKIVRLRVELRALRHAINELRNTIKKHSESAHAAQETDNKNQAIQKPIPVTVSYDQQANKDQDRSHGTQEGIRKWAKRAVIAASVYAAVAAWQGWEMRKAAIATRDSVDLARNNAHFDQRAWLNVTFGNYKYTIGEPFSTVYHVLNSGRTPARNVKGIVVVHLLKVAEKPVLTYTHGERAELGTVFPNFPQDGVSTLIPTVNPLGENPKPMIITAPIFQELSVGKSYILVYGKLTYDSVFGESHFIQFCMTSGAMQFSEPPECTEYNDVDNNENP